MTTLHPPPSGSITLFYLNSLPLSEVLSGLSALSVYCYYNSLVAFKLVILRFLIKFDELPFFGGSRVVNGLLPAGRSPTLQGSLAGGNTSLQQIVLGTLPLTSFSQSMESVILLLLLLLSKVYFDSFMPSLLLCLTGLSL